MKNKEKNEYNAVIYKNPFQEARFYSFYYHWWCSVYVNIMYQLLTQLWNFTMFLKSNTIAIKCYPIYNVFTGVFEEKNVIIVGTPVKPGSSPGTEASATPSRSTPRKQSKTCVKILYLIKSILKMTLFHGV